MTHNIHTHYMRYALRLGARGLGLSADNPSVGCVLVDNAHVVGVGYTGIGGRPHAETSAIDMAGDLCKGATAYVSLEPCAHVGNTPSCAKAFIDAGITTCYIATLDNDRRTNGQGVHMLQNAGVTVHSGILQAQADVQHMGFFHKNRYKRPLITVKIATSIDGKIALSSGDSQWITNAKSRAYGHYLRSTHDAILVGANTIRQDNPVLNCRLPGMHHTSPIRIVLATHLPPKCTVLNDNGQTHVLSGDLPTVLEKITDLGVTRLLVEGGGYTITQFIRTGLVDRIAHFQAAKIMGSDSISVIGGLHIANMIDIPTYDILQVKRFDNDIFTLYGRT